MPDGCGMLLSSLEDDEDAQPFYNAFGKISSRFGDEDGAVTAEEMSLFDVGPKGSIPKQLPTNSNRLTLFVEYCTVKRPTPSLKGRTERYEEVADQLQALFNEHFSDWSASQVDFVRNPHPAKSPYAFLPPDEAARYPGRLNSHAAPCFLKDMGEPLHHQLRVGKMVIDSSEFPPQLLRYPRIGALEVTYQLCDGQTPLVQKILYSKLGSGRWPSCAALIRDLAAKVQLDLYRQAKSHAQRAESSRLLAKERAAEAAEAEADAHAQQAVAEEAQRTCADLEVELQDALSHGNDEAAAKLRELLSEWKRTAERELLAAVACCRAAEATRVAHLQVSARTEVSEARLAMQSAKKELHDWELSQKVLEEALQESESYLARGDSVNASDLRAHAHTLQRAADRELAEVRTANEAATKELLEAVTAQLHAAEAHQAFEEGGEIADAKALLKAQEAVREAQVHVEDAEAQAAMTSADLEFREALSFVLQAKLATSDARNAPEGSKKFMLDRAEALKMRAVEELADARRVLVDAAKESIEAAEARYAKEEGEHQQSTQRLAEAEGLLLSRNGAPDAELEAKIAKLRAAADREGHQAVASKINVDMTREELRAKEEAIELSIVKVLSNDANAVSAQEERHRELEEAAAREWKEAEEATAMASQLDVDADRSHRAAAEAAAQVEVLARTLGRDHRQVVAAIEAERKASEAAARKRKEADRAAAVALRERIEAKVADVVQVEQEAADHDEEYQELAVDAETQRERVQAALEQVKQATASGDAGLEERASEILEELQGKLDVVARQAAEALDVARRNYDEAARMRDHIEVEQLQTAERAAVKARSLLSDVQDAASAAAAPGGASGQTGDAEAVAAAERRLEEARAYAAASQAHLNQEREAAGTAAVQRQVRIAEMTRAAAHRGEDAVRTVRRQLDSAQKRESATAGDAKQAQESGGLTALPSARVLLKRLEAAEARMARLNEQVEVANAAVEAAVQRKELGASEDFGAMASSLEVAADKAEAEAHDATNHYLAVVKVESSKGYLGDTEKKIIAAANQVQDQALAKAKRVRSEAEAARQKAAEALAQAMARIQELKAPPAADDAVSSGDPVVVEPAFDGQPQPTDAAPESET